MNGKGRTLDNSSFSNQNKYKDVIIMIKYKFTENLIYSQVFSFEVLNYFDSVTTEENFEWIEKYFNILIKNENITAEKFNIHHIRPCCTFKTNSRTKRTETKPLADAFNGNLIKLSIYNHFFAHFYLWKIFNNRDSKTAFQRMCGQGKYIDNLTEDELKDVARLKEECAKKNQTEEIKEYNKNYNKSDKRKKVSKKYHETHKNEDSYKERRKSYKEGKGKIRRQELNKRRYYDPKTENYYSHRNMVWRIKEFPQMYENMTIDNFRCISIEDDEYKNWKKQKEETSLNNKANWTREYKIKNREKRNKQARERHVKNREHDLELRKNRRNRPCYDPIEKGPCTYGQLENRIRRHKDRYGDIKLKDCLIKE